MAALLLAVAPTGCKEGDPIATAITPAIPEFLPESQCGEAGGAVLLRQGSIDGGRIVLDVVIRGVDEPTIGVAMKLTYPPQFSQFTACRDGDLFSSGGCQSNETNLGSGEVFVSRISTGGAVAVSGEQVVARLEFLVFGVSSGVITLEGQNLGGGDTTALLDSTGEPIIVEWCTGTLIGT